MQDETALLARLRGLEQENARLLEEQWTRLQETRALTGIGRLLSERLDPDVVGERIAESLRSLLGGGSAVVYRLDDDSANLLAMAVAHGPAAPTAGWRPVREIGSGAVGLAMRERRTITSPDVLADARMDIPPALRAHMDEGPDRAILAVPLLTQDRLIGVLAVRTATGTVFDARAVQLAEALADQAAITLEHARLFAEEERRRREAEVLADLARTIGAAPELATVLRRVDRGRAGALPQRRRGDRPADPRLRRGAAALLDGPVVHRPRPRPGRARQGARRPRARRGPPGAHRRLPPRCPDQPRLRGADRRARDHRQDGGADPDRRPGRGSALRGQPLGPRVHRPERVGPGAARRAGRHRDPQRPDPRGRADRPRHRGAAGPGAAGEPGPLPVRGPRHQRRGVGLGSREPRAVVERGRQHALRLHPGAGRPGRHVVVRDDPSGRSRPREARHQRGGGARRRELERGVSVSPGRRDVRQRLRPGLRAARWGRPAHADDRRDDGHHPALRARGRAPAGPEDGGGGPPRGRRRARLQQPAHDHHRPHPPGPRPAQGRRPGAPQRGGDPEDGRPRRRPHAAAPGLQPQAGAPAARSSTSTPW